MKTYLSIQLTGALLCGAAVTATLYEMRHTLPSPIQPGHASPEIVPKVATVLSGLAGQSPAPVQDESLASRIESLRRHFGKLVRQSGEEAVAEAVRSLTPGELDMVLPD